MTAALSAKALATICAAYIAGTATPAMVQQVKPKRPVAHRPVAHRPAKPARPAPKLASPAPEARVIACLPSQHLDMLPQVTLPAMAPDLLPVQVPAPPPAGPVWNLWAPYLPTDAHPPVFGGVPEPAGWTLLLTGFALVGLARRQEALR